MAEGTGGGFNVGELFKDRNFLNLLGNIGSDLNPNGIGGAAGRAAVNYNQGVASQGAAEGASAQRDSFMKALTALLTGEMTPKGDPGLTSITRTGNELSMKADLDSNQPGQEILKEQPASDNPATNASTAAANKSPNMLLSELLPF